jgi:D-cysteine desulfhydrase
MNTESILSTPLIDLLEYNGNHLWMKRDDLFPFSFGGNKARKAIGFFKEIDNGAYDCVVTYGTSSSNHCRVVANMAAQRDIPCYIISPEEKSAPTSNSKMMTLFGAEFTCCPVSQVSKTIDAKIQKLKNAGKKPYFIQGGGHGNIGTQAYVDCYEEISQFEEKNNIRFDYIFFASGTGTTQAGLVCGNLIKGDERKIVGFSIARKNPRGREVVIQSVKDYLSSKHIPFSGDDIESKVVFIDEYIGDGYGEKNSAITDTIKKVLLGYGIPMDSTYTGKAFAGMTAFLQKNSIVGKNVLFIHTGGTPLFFDDLKDLN